MTNKYTMEQKIAKLDELSDYAAYYYPKGTKERRDFLFRWLEFASLEGKEKILAEVEDSLLGRPHHAKTTWDVHTGVAFSKLYKALR